MKDLSTFTRSRLLAQLLLVWLSVLLAGCGKAERTNTDVSFHGAGATLTETGGNVVEPTGGRVGSTTGGTGTGGASTSGSEPTGGTGTGGDETGGATGTGGNETGGMPPTGGTGGTCTPGCYVDDLDGTEFPVFCEDGLEFLREECGYGCNPDLAECYECEDGTSVVECATEGEATETTTCIDGYWEAPVVEGCDYVCQGGGCAGSCKPGTTRCAGDDITLQTCEVGEWEDTEACSFVCQGGGCDGDCEPGSTRCAPSGTGTQECGSNGFWGAETACPAAAHETVTCSGAGVCGTSCAAGWNDCTSAAGCETQFGSLSNCAGCGDVCTAPSHASPFCGGSGCNWNCDTTWGNCDGNNSNGCEQDIWDDPDNCGGCGIVCLGGGSCTAGECEYPDVEPVAEWTWGAPDGLNSEFDIDGTYIYSPCVIADQPGICRAPKDGSDTFEQVHATSEYVRYVHIVENNVVFASELNDGIYRYYELAAVPCDGGTERHLAYTTSVRVDDYLPMERLLVQFDGTYVYFNEGRGSKSDLIYAETIFRVPLAGGTREAIVDEWDFDVASFVLDNGKIHGLFNASYSSGFDGAEMTYTAGGGSNETWIAGFKDPINATTNGTYLFWFDDRNNETWRATLSNIQGTAAVLAFDTAFMPVVVDGSWLYGIGGEGIAKASVNGGMIVSLSGAENPQPRPVIKVDGSYVYWYDSTEGNTVGRFLRTPK